MRALTSQEQADIMLAADQRRRAMRADDPACDCSRCCDLRWERDRDAALALMIERAANA